jgi:RimJ/RimL family protein N-acetyltransferase
MTIGETRDKTALEGLFRRAPQLFLYHLGDLDDFFWPSTRWFALADGDLLEEVVLYYSASSPTVLLALCRDAERMGRLLGAIDKTYPDEFYAHLSPGLEEIFRPAYEIRPHGRHLRMALTQRDRVDGVPTSIAEPLGEGDLEDLLRLYRASYPGNWFDPRMLRTGQYFGIRSEGELVSAAGVHVYSPRYGAAALGNITTHPAHRGRGLGRTVTARVCQSLLETVGVIGLNVKDDNLPAITCYEKLGFTRAAIYGEFMLRRT